MKSSPLQLEWVTYPKLSYEANQEFEPGDDPVGMPIECTAEVVYTRDGHHLAELILKNEASTALQQPYFFEVHVFARFQVDIEIARETYRGNGFPRIAAVNVSRILLSSARDLLSTVTARSPHGTAMIQSVLLEPGDVKIAYEGNITTYKRDIFGIEDEGAKHATTASQDASHKAAPKRRSASAKQKPPAKRS